ncbi:uncharacterized protein M421DRAFT_10500 [Didymella exigua CBS 183.55]|uniref:Uncharacterized protein n=1 Tax=Didymella exigua CBS 183.55 TaxID=1150837 RepID=A0A6A5R9I5_9PLEO|nr:uncharacterized protein M421DRAFT_10500 [Didymella exigua CBS 183.55]KAF1922497.1 hypothetical protein M421DRAFT_10500 [Didymella exigua CBS 183.55]
MNVANNEDNTALTIALDQMAREIVLQILQAGAELNVVQHSRLVSLTISSKDTPLLDLVISKKVSLDGAVYYALDSRLGLDYQYLLNLLLKLIKAEANLVQLEELQDATLPRFSPTEDRHAIIVASRRGITNPVDMLLSSSASTTDRNKYRESALLVAVRYAQLLHENAPTAVNIADDNGATVLSNH